MPAAASNQKIHAGSERAAQTAEPPATAAQTRLSKETVFGLRPSFSMARDKNRAHAVPRDFKGRRAVGLPLMDTKLTT